MLGWFHAGHRIGACECRRSIARPHARARSRPVMTCAWRAAPAPSPVTPLGWPMASCRAISPSCRATGRRIFCASALPIRNPVRCSACPTPAARASPRLAPHRLAALPGVAGRVGQAPRSGALHGAHAAEATASCGTAQPGSIPVFLMIGAASGAVRNLSSARPASGAVAALCTPAENTVTSWMSGGSGPR
jgi:hypothetical protein